MKENLIGQNTGMCIVRLSPWTIFREIVLKTLNEDKKRKDKFRNILL